MIYTSDKLDALKRENTALKNQLDNLQYLYHTAVSELNTIKERYAVDLALRNAELARAESVFERIVTLIRTGVPVDEPSSNSPVSNAS